MPRLRPGVTRWWTAAAALICVAVAPAQSLPDVTFRAGDLKAITCRATGVKSDSMGTTRLTVQVDNRSPHAFEPTLFAVRWTDAGGNPFHAELARVPLPRIRRAGRAVGPRQRLDFQLQLGAPTVKKLEVEVREGLFRDPVALPEVPVQVGGIRQELARNADGTLPNSMVALRNTLDQPVDVVLRARCSAPKDGEVLLTAQLAAGASEPVRFQLLPMQLAWHDHRSYYPGIRIEQLEVVDWSVRLPAEPGAAAALLQPAYDAWLRWPEPCPALRGSFTAVQGGSMRAPVTAVGTFTIAPSGEVRTEAATPEAAALGRQHIEWVLRELRRPAWTAVVAASQLELVAHDLVRVQGPGWGDRANAPSEAVTIRPDGSTASTPVAADDPIYRIADRRIVADGGAETPDATTWTTQNLGPGYVVVERRGNGGTTIQRHGYQLLGDVVAPTRYQQLMLDTAGKVLLEDLLLLADLALAPEVTDTPRPVPTGPAADALRAAWDRIYRYPDTPARWTARVLCKNPGTDDVWLGLRKVEGRVDCGGFVGFRWTRACWESIDVELQGSHLPDAARALAFAVTDRLGMWRGRDPAGFEDFDRMFAGAELAWDAAAGVFRLGGCPLREVRVQDGKVASVLTAAGVERAYQWQEQDGRLLATRIRSGGETITARWSKAGDGWWLPAAIEFRDVFGKDWGPEQLTLSQSAVR